MDVYIVREGMEIYVYIGSLMSQYVIPYWTQISLSHVSALSKFQYRVTSS